MCMLCSSTGTNSSPKKDGEDSLTKVVTIANISNNINVCVCVCMHVCLIIIIIIIITIFIIS